MTEEEVRRIARKEIEEAVERAIQKRHAHNILGPALSEPMDPLEVFLEAVKERSRS